MSAAPQATQPAALAGSIDAWIGIQLAAVEQALSRWVTASGPVGQTDAAGELAVAMRYAVQGGGKRLRPLLVLGACEAVGGHRHAAGREAALRAACAVELIHAYSLVHDDMPCMDNDVLRRGKPTVHVQFGQALALLAGDALQALAFELLTPAQGDMPAPLQAKLCRLLAQAAGVAGMAGGQAIDLASVGLKLDAAQLSQMHRLKTGALLQASVDMGAACGGEPPLPTLAARAFSSFGSAIGLAFQVVDDVLDVTADAAALGKTVGKDAQQDKPTYVALLGLAAAQTYAQQLLDEALAALDQLDAMGYPTPVLRALAYKLVQRAY